MSDKKYLTPYPQVTKRVQANTERSHYDITDNEHDEIVSQLKQQQQNRLQELEHKLAYLQQETKVQTDSLHYYDADHELAKIQAAIQLAKNEEKNFSKQIENCQLVEDTTTPEEYFLWKKKQRIDAFDAAVAELYEESAQEREDLEAELNEMHQKNLNLKNQIALMEDKVIKKPTPQPQEEEEEFIIDENQLQSLREEHKNLNGTVKMLEQNIEILSTQLFDQIQKMQADLSDFYTASKNSLAKDLKAMELEIQNQEISPVTSEEKEFSILPIVKQYHQKMDQLSQKLSKEMRNEVSNLLEPFDWENFDWKQYKSQEPASVHSYEEYRRLEFQYMENQEEIQQFETQLKQIISETNSYKQKNMDLDLAIKSMIKMVSK